MSVNENGRENQDELEQLDELEPALEPDDPEYVGRSKGARMLAWILAILMIIGVLLYFGWISGVIHE